VQSKLLTLQKAILRKGLKAAYHQPCSDAFNKGVADKWTALGRPQKPDPTEGAFYLEDAMIQLYPELEEHIRQSYWYPRRNEGGTERREALLGVRAAVSRSLRRLAERGLIEKISNRKCKLTPDGIDIAAILFPDSEKPTDKDIKEAYQRGWNFPKPIRLR
jgi:hypothetical protein